MIIRQLRRDFLRDELHRRARCGVAGGALNLMATRPKSSLQLIIVPDGMVRLLIRARVAGNGRGVLRRSVVERTRMFGNGERRADLLRNGERETGSLSADWNMKGTIPKRG